MNSPEEKYIGARAVIPLSELIVDPEVQPRAKGLDEPTVESYREALRMGDEFPPVVAYGHFDDDEGLYLSEGFHRVEAHLREGKEYISVLVRHVDGNPKAAAIENALTSNRTHGLARSPEDKRRAAEGMLKLHPEWADRAIEKKIGVSAKTIASVRAELEAGAEIPQCSTRIGLDGRAQPASKPQTSSTLHTIHLVDSNWQQSTIVIDISDDSQKLDRHGRAALNRELLASEYVRNGEWGATVGTPSFAKLVQDGRYDELNRRLIAEREGQHVIEVEPNSLTIRPELRFWKQPLTDPRLVSFVGYLACVCPLSGVDFDESPIVYKVGQELILVAGFLRVAASKRAGTKKLKCMVRTGNVSSVIYAAVWESVSDFMADRRELPLTEGCLIKKIQTIRDNPKIFGGSSDELIAEKLGISVAAVHHLDRISSSKAA